MADYNIAYDFTRSNEGDVVTEDPTDTGLLSYAGISSKWHPDWAGFSVIRQRGAKAGQHLPELDMLVKNFYRSEYWDKIKGDDIPSQDLANQEFDMAVNAGIGTANNILKQSV